MTIKSAILALLNRLGYHLIRTEPPGPSDDTSTLPDAECYLPFFSPWYRDAEFQRAFSQAAPWTIVTVDRCHVLWTLATQALQLPGDFWECGVYKGGTARLLAERLDDSRKTLRLFDTFGGMPTTGPEDLHGEGDFSDTSLASVREHVGHADRVKYYPGQMPGTFDASDDSPIAFAHIDVDIYRSILDCCAHIYPRLVPGGIMVFDDYGFPSCPGARKGVDEFFADKPERPLILPNAQAIVIRLDRTRT